MTMMVTMIIVVFVVFVVVVVVIIKFKRCDRGRKDIIPRSGLNPCIPVLPILTLRIIAWSRQCSAFDAATAVPGTIRLVSWLEDCLARFFVVERATRLAWPMIWQVLVKSGMIVECIAIDALAVLLMMMAIARGAEL